MQMWGVVKELEIKYRHNYDKEMINNALSFIIHSLVF